MDMEHSSDSEFCIESQLYNECLPFTISDQQRQWKSAAVEVHWQADALTSPPPLHT